MTTPDNLGMLMIYAVLLPTLATIFTIYSFKFLKNFLPSMMAAILWFVSGLSSANIIFINNYTVTASPYYVHMGNPELAALFMGLGVILSFHAFFIALKQASEVGWINVK
jgi:hypothetical protein